MVTTYAFFPSSPRCVPRCSYVLHTRMIPFSSAGPCEPQTASVCSLPSSESVCCKIWLLTPYSVLSLFSSNQPTGFCPSAVLAGKSDKRSAFFGISFRSVGKLKPSHTHTCLNLCRALSGDVLTTTETEGRQRCVWTGLGSVADLCWEGQEQTEQTLCLSSRRLYQRFWSSQAWHFCIRRKAVGEEPTVKDNFV